MLFFSFYNIFFTPTSIHSAAVHIRLIAAILQSFIIDIEYHIHFNRSCLFANKQGYIVLILNYGFRANASKNLIQTACVWHKALYIFFSNMSSWFSFKSDKTFIHFFYFFLRPIILFIPYSIFNYKLKDLPFSLQVSSCSDFFLTKSDNRYKLIFF